MLLYYFFFFVIIMFCDNVDLLLLVVVESSSRDEHIFHRWLNRLCECVPPPYHRVSDATPVRMQVAE